MARKRISTLVADVDAIATHLKTRLGEVTHLTGLQTELEGWLAEARDLESQREVHTGRLRQIDAVRRSTEARGVELRARAVDNLRGHFGGRAKVLLEFGIRPRSSGGGRRKPATPEQTTTPVTLAPESSPAPPGEAGSSG